MKIHSILGWTHDEAERAYGGHEAFARCNDELKRLVDADSVELKVVLMSVPEPSNIERSTWPQATMAYVEMLEELVDSLIDTK